MLGEVASDVERCACGDDDPDGCVYLAFGYPWCRPCDDHHRPPECAVDSDGYALALCGCRWDVIMVDVNAHTCRYSGG